MLLPKRLNGCRTTHQPSAAEACLLFLVMGAGEQAQHAGQPYFVLNEGAALLIANRRSPIVTSGCRIARLAQGTSAPQLLPCTSSTCASTLLAVYLHHLPDLLGSSPAALNLLDNHLAYCGLATLVLAAPGAALAAAHSTVTAFGSGSSVLRSLLSSSDAEAGGATLRLPLLTLCYG